MQSRPLQSLSWRVVDSWTSLFEFDLVQRMLKAKEKWIIFILGDSLGTFTNSHSILRIQWLNVRIVPPWVILNAFEHKLKTFRTICSRWLNVAFSLSLTLMYVTGVYTFLFLMLHLHEWKEMCVRVYNSTIFDTEHLMLFHVQNMNLNCWHWYSTL